MAVITHDDRDVVVKNPFHVILQSGLGVSSNPIILDRFLFGVLSVMVCLCACMWQ